MESFSCSWSHFSLPFLLDFLYTLNFLLKTGDFEYYNVVVLEIRFTLPTDLLLFDCWRLCFNELVISQTIYKDSVLYFLACMVTEVFVLVVSSDVIVISSNTLEPKRKKKLLLWFRLKWCTLSAISQVICSSFFAFVSYLQMTRDQPELQAQDSYRSFLGVCLALKMCALVWICCYK